MKLNEEKGKEPFIPERVARSIIRVPMKTRTIPPATRTNCYLIHDGGGWLVVDFGSPDGSAFSMLDEAVEEFGGAVVGVVDDFLDDGHREGGVGGWEREPWLKRESGQDASPCWRRAAVRVLEMSMAMVMGPTPPGTGVMAAQRGETEAKSTSPTMR